jgi:hypothetical protein
MTTRNTSDPDKTINIRNFMNLGFKDYIAARVLLNSGLLLQGAILASTSIEKYFKAILAFRGNLIEKHLNNAHLNSIKNYDPKLYGSLNESYLLFLQKSYKLRYFDNIKAGFRLAVHQRATLSELDYTVSSIQKRIKIIRGEEKLLTMYDSAVQGIDQNLFLNNYILNNINKDTFLQQEESLIYTMIVDDTHGLIEVIYSAVKGIHKGDFLTEGLLQKE